MSNGLLLDTHVFVWAVGDPARISDTGWALLDDPSLTLYLSVASAWELAVKASIGKLGLPVGVREFVADGCADAHIDLLPIDLAHVAAVEALPFHHRDPFDRMLVAQAQVSGVPILSYDATLDAYDVTRVG